MTEKAQFLGLMFLQVV